MSYPIQWLNLVYSFCLKWGCLTETRLSKRNERVCWMVMYMRSTRRILFLCSMHLSGGAKGDDMCICFLSSFFPPSMIELEPVRDFFSNLLVGFFYTVFLYSGICGFVSLCSMPLVAGAGVW